MNLNNYSIEYGQNHEQNHEQSHAQNHEHHILHDFNHLNSSNTRHNEPSILPRRN